MHVVLIGLMAIELFPLYMMFQVSLKNNVEFVEQPWLPTNPAKWHLENWAYGIKMIGPKVVNTLLVSGLSTILTLAGAICGAYFFARYRMPCSRLLWSLFLLLMLMPSVANIVPLFALLKHLKLLNSLWAVIIVGVASAQVFNIFVLKSFIGDLPRDYFEAAEIDGAGHWQQIQNIVIPMSAPIIGTLGILAFLNQWNDFLMPLLVLRDTELFTVGVGLIYLDGEYVKQWGEIMASYFLAAMPLIVVFLFTSRLFIRGLSAGGLKG